MRKLFLSFQFTQWILKKCFKSTCPPSLRFPWNAEFLTWIPSRGGWIPSLRLDSRLNSLAAAEFPPCGWIFGWIPSRRLDSLSESLRHPLELASRAVCGQNPWIPSIHGRGFQKRVVKSLWSRRIVFKPVISPRNHFPQERIGSEGLKPFKKPNIMTFSQHPSYNDLLILGM